MVFGRHQRVCSAHRFENLSVDPALTYAIARAEWREQCIDAAGTPLSACSYFLSEEFPQFMKFFYVTYLLIFCFESVLRVRLFTSRPANTAQHAVAWIGLVSFSHGGS